MGTKKFSRIVAFSDLHGDVECLAHSLVEKKIFYEADDIVDRIQSLVEEQADANILEELVIPQEFPTLLLFLGDCLDRYRYGYHILQLIQQIQWKKFQIHLEVLMGNHDLLNLMFFLNPYQLHHLHQGSGFSPSDVLYYISRMGLDQSLRGFIELHGHEIIQEQRKFYQQGFWEFSLPEYTARFQYSEDLSGLNEISSIKKENRWDYHRKLAQKLGLEMPKEHGSIRGGYNPWENSLFSNQIYYYLEKYAQKTGITNWWGLPKQHSENISKANLLEYSSSHEDLEILPIDWRILSLIWRKHYGEFFSQAKLFYLNQSTLFVHGGISPMAMTDSISFGSLYRHQKGEFKSLESTRGDLGLLVERKNRLFQQIIQDSLFNFTFRNMAGIEILDQIGYWRGSAEGFPFYAGPLWADFNFLSSELRREREVHRDGPLKKLYQNFAKETGIRRIICGHTRFLVEERSSPRYLISDEFQKIGLEYICIDNSCSQGYRDDAYEDLADVLNGIEIDANGKITDEGDTHLS